MKLAVLTGWIVFDQQLSYIDIVTGKSLVFFFHMWYMFIAIGGMPHQFQLNGIVLLFFNVLKMFKWIHVLFWVVFPWDLRMQEEKWRLLFK